MKGSGRYFVEGVSCRLGSRELRVVNLSVNGLFVETTAPPAGGHALDLEVSLPLSGPVGLSGRVAWVNEPATPRSPALPPGFGFQVERMPFSAKMAIIACLRSTGTLLQHPSDLPS